MDDPLPQIHLTYKQKEGRTVLRRGKLDSHSEITLEWELPVTSDPNFEIKV